MGSNFSHPSLTPSERDVYFQVKNTLIVGQFKFSKGNLKHFIHWIFKFFPNTNANSVLSSSFWDSARRQLNVVQLNRDLSVVKSFPLFQIIIKAIEKAGSGSGKSSCVLEKFVGPQLKTPSPLPSPHVPKPSSLTEGGSVGGSHNLTQGCY